MRKRERDNMRERERKREYARVSKDGEQLEIVGENDGEMVK